MGSGSARGKSGPAGVCACASKRRGLARPAAAAAAASCSAGQRRDLAGGSYSSRRLQKCRKREWESRVLHTGVVMSGRAPAPSHHTQEASGVQLVRPWRLVRVAVVRRVALGVALWVGLVRLRGEVRRGAGVANKRLRHGGVIRDTVAPRVHPHIAARGGKGGSSAAAERVKGQAGRQGVRPITRLEQAQPPLQRRSLPAHPAAGCPRQELRSPAGITHDHALAVVVSHAAAAAHRPVLQAACVRAWGRRGGEVIEGGTGAGMHEGEPGAPDWGAGWNAGGLHICCCSTASNSSGSSGGSAPA